MRFLKDLFFWNALTSKDPMTKLANAALYEEILEKERILEDNEQTAEWLIMKIEDLHISKAKKKEAIKYANKIGKTYKEKEVNMLLKKINELTGRNFKIEV